MGSWVFFFNFGIILFLYFVAAQQFDPWALHFSHWKKWKELKLKRKRREKNPPDSHHRQRRKKFLFGVLPGFLPSFFCCVVVVFSVSSDCVAPKLGSRRLCNDDGWRSPRWCVGNNWLVGFDAAPWHREKEHIKDSMQTRFNRTDTHKKRTS